MEKIPGFHVVFWISNFIMWCLFVYLKVVNPGYVASNHEAYEKAQKMVNYDCIILNNNVLHWNLSIGVPLGQVKLSSFPR